MQKELKEVIADNLPTFSQCYYRMERMPTRYELMDAANVIIAAVKSAGYTVTPTTNPGENGPA